VLKIVEGLPEDAWQTPVVPSGWTVAGMLHRTLTRDCLDNGSAALSVVTVGC
jgi:hypothetical protein